MTIPARVFVLILVVTRAAQPQTPEELAQTASHAMQQQDYATAEKAYRQFIQLSPDVAEVHSNLGVACYSQNKFPCAEEALTHALKLAPELFVPNFVLGEIRFQQGRYQEALGLLTKAVKLQPDNKEARKLYIAALVGLKQYDRSVEEYNRALDVDPNDVDSYYGLGSVYLDIGRGVIQRLADEPGYTALMRAQHYQALRRVARVGGERIPGCYRQIAVGPGNSSGVRQPRDGSEELGCCKERSSRGTPAGHG